MMKIDLILLSGTPASGKDTLTNGLKSLDTRFVHFKKHKISSGGKLDDTYHLVSKDEFDEMAQNGKFVQYHYRYDRGYGVSESELKLLKEINKIPIIHVGKYENIAKFRNFGLKNILSVFLFTDRNITTERLKIRHPNNSIEIEKRLAAYDEEISILKDKIAENVRLDFDISIKNNSNDVEVATHELYEKILYMERNMESIEELVCP